MDTPTGQRTNTDNDASVRRTSPTAKLPVFDSLSLDELRGEWRRFYHRDPPRISRAGA